MLQVTKESVKNKIAILGLVIIGMLIAVSCQNKQDYNFILPTIPEGYVVDKNLYLAEGDGIYAFIENQTLDYGTIRAEICNGNALTIQKKFKERGNPEKNPEEYVAIQNILGITEIYLGNYRDAYGYFNDTIDFLNKSNIAKKNKFLTVLYNNAGAVTFDLSTNAAEDKRLIKAAKLCEEPYMGLVIAVNQTGRTKTYASVKEYGEMIVRSMKLIEREAQIDSSPNYVLFTAARFVAVGYLFSDQKDKAIEVLNEYISLVPDAPEYNLTSARMLSYRAYCYHIQEEYEIAIEDYKSSIALAEKTVDENSRQLAITNNGLGVSYMECEEVDTALLYIEKAIPGYRYATASDKGVLYWNVGNAYWQLNQNENAKKYLLKAYINQEKVKKNLGAAAGEGYGKSVENVLYELYELEENFTLSFPKWLDKESEQYIEEESRYEKFPE